jgi:hypothetical protein
MSSKPLCTCSAGMQYESRIAELERENETWKANHSGMKDLSDLKSERIVMLELQIKNLMKLHRDVIRTERWMHHFKRDRVGNDQAKKLAEDDWQSYCKEHNIKVDTDGK